MSWTSMFNEAMFRDMFQLSSSYVNDYVVHIYSKYMNPDGNNRNCGPVWEEVMQCN